MDTDGARPWLMGRLTLAAFTPMPPQPGASRFHPPNLQHCVADPSMIWRGHQTDGDGDGDGDGPMLDLIGPFSSFLLPVVPSVRVAGCSTADPPVFT
jgi:hypothetical protein